MRSALLPILAVLSVTACAAPAEDDVSSTEDAVTTDEIGRASCRERV